MAKNEENTKLKVSSKRIIIIFIVLFFVFEGIFYISFQYKNFWPLETSFFYYTPALILLSVVFCYISLKKTYYEVNKTRLLHVKMGKESEYKWSSIIYIDENWSKKHKMLMFYLEDGKARYLAFDKNGIIFEYALKYSHQISYEEFMSRFSKTNL